MIQALALAAQNAGWPEPEFVGALLDPIHGAGDKVRRRSDAPRYLPRCWEQAHRRAIRAPVARVRADVLAVLDGIRAAVAATRWVRHSDRLILDAHLGVAEHTGKLEHGLDVRTLAELSGYSLGTVSAARRRLIAAGWLRLAHSARPRRAEAARWVIKLPRAVLGRTIPDTLVYETTVQSSTAASAALREKTVHRSTGGEAQHDLWRRGGLGPARFGVWRLLSVEPQPAGAVAKRIGRGARIVRRHLRRLEAHGLAVCDRAGWRRGPASLDHVADTIGIAGLGAQQRRRHAEDRIRFRAALEALERHR